MTARNTTIRDSHRAQIAKTQPRCTSAVTPIHCWQVHRVIAATTGASTSPPARFAIRWPGGIAGWKAASAATFLSAQTRPAPTNATSPPSARGVGLSVFPLLAPADLEQVRRFDQGSCQVAGSADTPSAGCHLDMNDRAI